VHIHLVTHCRKPQDETKPPTKYDLRGAAAISDQAHNVITVWANKAKKAKLEEGGDPGLLNDPDALLTVEKQRNGRWEGRAKLWFDDQSMRFCDDGSLNTTPYAGLTQ
jgi:twinkle protein